MGLTRAQLKERAAKKLTDYIESHGTKIDEGLIIWNKEPICVKDICVLSVVIENGRVIFCDYDLEKRTYKESFSRTYEDLDHHYLADILEDLMAKDAWADRTKSKKKK